MSTENTIITQEVDLDIDSWLAAPGGDQITLPKDTKVKPSNIFAPREKLNLDFIDDVDKVDEIIVQKEELNEDGSVKTEKITQKSDDFLNELTNEPTDDLETEQQVDKSKGGRPKTEKSGLVEFLKKRITEKEMETFDDFDDETGDLDEYLGAMSENDIEELWKANMDTIKTKVAVETPQQFYDSLPKELQYAAKYVMDGGDDLKGLFKALAHVEETRSLDPEAEDDQEHIVRNYLLATNFGDESEIDEEIDEWKNLGSLEKKAKQFKPKLDAMQEQQVANRIATQELNKKKQEEAATTYVNNTFEALKTGELNGIKLDKKVQSQLYTGLVKPQYTSVNGNPTNLLGHLLEKYQFVEPNQALIAEALWLLSNPTEYRENLAKVSKNSVIEDVARKLKTEESRKKVTGSGVLEDKSRSLKPTRQTNIFKR